MGSKSSHESAPSVSFDGNRRSSVQRATTQPQRSEAPQPNVRSIAQPQSSAFVPHGIVQGTSRYQPITLVQQQSVRATAPPLPSASIPQGIVQPGTSRFQPSALVQQKSVRAPAPPLPSGLVPQKIVQSITPQPHQQIQPTRPPAINLQQNDLSRHLSGHSATPQQPLAPPTGMIPGRYIPPLLPIQSRPNTDLAEPNFRAPNTQASNHNPAQNLAFANNSETNPEVSRGAKKKAQITENWRARENSRKQNNSRGRGSGNDTDDAMGTPRSTGSQDDFQGHNRRGRFQERGAMNGRDGYEEANGNGFQAYGRENRSNVGNAQRGRGARGRGGYQGQGGQGRNENQGYNKANNNDFHGYDRGENGGNAQRDRRRGRRGREGLEGNSRQEYNEAGNNGFQGLRNDGNNAQRGRGRRGRGGFEAQDDHERNAHQGFNDVNGIRFQGQPNGDGNNGGQGGGSQAEQRYPIGYRKLEEWCKLEDATELVNLVANKRNGFFLLMEADEQTLTFDKIMLIMHVLAKVCAAEFDNSKQEILITTCKSKSFLEKLRNHVSKFWEETRTERKAAIPKFFEHSLVFSETIMGLLPQTACDHLPMVLQLIIGSMAQVNMSQGIVFEQKLTDKVARLFEELKLSVEKRKRIKQQEKTESQHSHLHDRPPPNDYREISIFPQPEDVITRQSAFIRPNIVEGAYHDVNHYLDVQFRLMREDFVSPLRDGITDMGDKTKKKINNVKVYRKVQFESIFMTRDKVGLVVHFEMKGKINWEHSKRLMFGSLLCFTKDNFRNIIFATVLDRKVDELKKGRIVVEISHDTETEEHKFKVDYVMVESEVFFPPYQHVLAALQHMGPENFPMSQYIVHVQAETHPPQYVAENRDFIYHIEDYGVQILDEGQWPSANQLKLDPSQYRAFQLALTQEFVVIQGPPGTGKTYLGLKIARTLLLNVERLLARVRGQTRPAPNRRIVVEEPVGIKHAWKSPILVVCFTNHALDQFLEGLIPTTQNMIRLGGQSRSEELKKYNLREKRSGRSHNRDRMWRTREIKERLSVLMARIKGIASDMTKINDCVGIVSLHSFAEVLTVEALSATFINVDGNLNDALLLDWLRAGLVAATFNEAFPIGNAAPAVPLDEEEDEDEMLENQAERQRGDEAWQREADDDYDIDSEVVERVTVELAQDLAIFRGRKSEISRQIQGAQNEAQVRDLERKRLEIDRELNYWTRCLREPPGIPAPNDLNGVNLWGLNPNERWAIYHQWLNVLRRTIAAELRGIEMEYNREARMLDEIRDMENLEIMREADVIGMTTTMAAKSRSLLQALKPRIVIVEEAAEVMESHIVVSLSAHCQHLILIGDHKQLKPTTAVYRLAREYKFDISLFERMLNNGMHCEQLKVQHRMRPEVVRLIVPAIYKELINHESVLKYDRVRGVDKSMFFFTHSNKEQEVEETKSRSNAFEGDLILSLCRHILLQGYDPSRITILTTYSGQMFYLRQERKRNKAYELLRDVQITIVDNFQGEENDIILLSLVRNNKENNVGFLKIENRVCVALSRAKQGLYILGNISNLMNSSDHKDAVWKKIKVALDELDAVGEELVLRCEIHPDQLTSVRSAQDFNKIPEGGCRRVCGTGLTCGHDCKSMCHVTDREHKTYRCLEDCTRVPPRCDLEHTCTKPCHATCGDCLVSVMRTLPCGHEISLLCHIDHLTYKCQVTVPVEGSSCGHDFVKPCHVPIAQAKCPIPCVNRLACGHVCTKKCHVDDDPDHIVYKCVMDCAKKNAGCTRDHPCQRKCWEECGLCIMEVRKQPANCDHLHKVPCNVLPEMITCERPCRRQIPDCGHDCKKKCNEPCGGCAVMVEKTIAECGHKVKTKCCEPALRRHCRAACERKTTCGHACMRQCKEECSRANECRALVASSVVSACGHAVKVPCNVEIQRLPADSLELMSYCEEPCWTQLKCEHACEGSCGKCSQGRIHIGCKSDCNRTLVCGHACKEPCAKACTTCKENCALTCKHSKCSMKCGIPCVSCKMECPWKCEHSKCSRKCGELCDRVPCYEPCLKQRKCGHPCIGFCGEPCPPLCRVCDKDEVTEIFFGDEDEPDARFVYLVDCKHTVESQGMESWLEVKDETIKIPQCPKCKTNIMQTFRFMNIVKTALKDVQSIKKKAFGNRETINGLRTEALDKLKELARNAAVNISYLSEEVRSNRNHFFIEHISHFGSGFTKPVEEMFKKLFTNLQLVVENRNNFLSYTDVQVMHNKIDILAELCKAYKTAPPGKILTDQLNFLVRNVGQRQYLSEQEIDDFNLELKRFQRFTQFCKLAQRTNNTEYTRAYKLLTSVQKYTNVVDMTLDDLFKKMGLQEAQEERKQIIKAMGMLQGHWNKCPNGHYYVIGECGGAVVVGRCPDCNAQIGGTGHRLLASNRIATEIDGATMSAYDQNVAAGSPF